MRVSLRRVLSKFLSSKPSPVHSGEASWTAPSVGALSIDGFGSFPATQTALPVGNCGSQCFLKDIQILTRFCAAEKPYWPGFLSHYSGMGAEAIHVCVQSETERDWLLKTADEYSGGALVVVHLVSSDVTPNVALQGLNLNRIREGAEFTLLVDCDEFVGSLKTVNCLRSVLDLYPDHYQWHLPWLMRTLIANADIARGGYWGHVGKPVVRSEYMQSVINDHCFSACISGQQADSSSTVPLGVHGLVVVHLWSRSFADSLIKVFCNRFGRGFGCSCGC